MTARTLRIGIGIVLVAAGVVLVFSPVEVAEALGRPHETGPQRMNLRASWGGTAVGLGAFVAWLPALRPWARAALGLLLWAMAGVGVARAIGFALDGQPDTRQYIWIAAEVLIVIACAVLLRRRART